MYIRRGVMVRVKVTTPSVSLRSASSNIKKIQGISNNTTMSRSEELVLLPDPTADRCVLHLADDEYTLRILEEHRTVGDGVVMTGVHEDLHPITTIVCSDISHQAPRVGGPVSLPTRDLSYKRFSIEFYNLDPPRPSGRPLRIEVDLMRAWLPKLLLLMVVDPIHMNDPPVITCKISHDGKVDFYDDFLADYERIDLSRGSMESMADDSDLLEYCYGGDGNENN